MEPLERFLLRQFAAPSASRSATSATFSPNIYLLLSSMTPLRIFAAGAAFGNTFAGAVDVDVTRVMDVLLYNLEPRRARLRTLV